MAILLLGAMLPGVEVLHFWVAIIMAVVTMFLNDIVRPIILMLTLPVSMVTFGLFVPVINVGLILLADYVVPGFSISGWLLALIFSVLLAVLQAVLYPVLDKDEK